MRSRTESRGFHVNIPAMIHIDLSNSIPRRAFTYFLVFLPGFFFEASILFGNPALISKLVGILRQTLPPNRYIEMGPVVFVAFVVGTAFMLGITLLQFFATGVFYWVWEVLRAAFFKIRMACHAKMLCFPNDYVDTNGRVVESLHLRLSQECSRSNGAARRSV